MSRRARALEVCRVDPGDVAAFDEWFAVLRATDLERYPEGPGWQRAERLAMARDRDGPVEHRCLAARADDGAVAGIADLEMFRRDNRHVARLDVRVLAARRRGGIGTALVEAAARDARDAGRTELGGKDESPVRDGYVDGAGPFARRLGFHPAQHMVRRGLELPLRPEHERALRRDPRASPEGYSLLTFFDRWPEADLEDRCELGRRMSTDAPAGEHELDEEVWDAPRVRAVEAGLAAQHRAKVTTAARHGASGRLVAFSEVVVPLGAPESAWQHDTLVLREHRGHGLGFATKVANLWALAERHPGVRTINTWNDAQNRHMIAVNEALGFEVVAHAVSWRKELTGAPIA